MGPDEKGMAFGEPYVSSAMFIRCFNCDLRDTQRIIGTSGNPR